MDRTYRTQPGPEHTGIGGSSMGGLVALYLGLKHPDVFGRVAVLSTSVWWDDRFIVRFVDGLPAKPAVRIWADIGTKEGYSALPDARALRDALLRKGWREGEDLRYVEVPGAVHSETAWAKRMPEVLAFLFPPAVTPSAAAPSPTARPGP